MKICFLMERPRSTTSVTYDLLSFLQQAGAEVDVVTEQATLIDVGKFPFDYDLFLFKSHSPLAESIAAAANHRGRRLLNPYPATMKVRNKMLTSTLLLRAGIPTPRTFVTDSLVKLEPIVREMPLVIKPFMDTRGRSVEFCWNERDLVSLMQRRPRTGTGRLVFPEELAEGGEDGSALGDTLIFAQEYVYRDPFSYKAYAIGDHVHAIRKHDSSLSDEARAGTAVEGDDDLEELVRRCGRVFGLELYGVDLVRGPKGYAVIEVNCFPGYKGVPHAGRRLAEYILERAESATAGGLA